MARKLFGTDGIRGLANKFPMTPEIALKVGMAAGRIFMRGDHRHRVVIGKDTRLSGYMIESALVSGFTSVGMDVFQFGPLPTPAVAMLTRSLRADLGVMISASHNAYHDNGIKLFGPDGQKLSDEREEEIEALMENGLEDGLAEPTNIGRARRIEDAQARYIEFVKRTFPKHLRLEGLRIVVDCAHGASYRVAPAVLWELGADIVAIGVEPNLKPLCIALDPADSRGVWWWEGGADCSTRSTSDVFRGDRGTVSSQGATTTASFQLGLIGDPRRGDPMSQSVSVALTDGRLRSVATGSEQRTVRRAELSIPLLIGR